jgi:hypothetical protein
MLDWEKKMSLKIELLPLVMNIGIASFYVYQWKEPGKCLYWIGAVLLTLGLLRMKG